MAVFVYQFIKKNQCRLYTMCPDSVGQEMNRSGQTLVATAIWRWFGCHFGLTDAHFPNFK